jgi:hypothetical protein
MSGQTYTTLGQYGNIEDRSCSECDNIIESSYLPYIFDINFRKKQDVSYELLCDTCYKEEEDLEEDFIAGLGGMRGGGGRGGGRGGGYRPRGGGYRPRGGMGLGHWRRYPRRYGYPVYTYPINYDYPINYPVYDYTYPHSACYTQETDGSNKFSGCFPQCSANELNKGIYTDKDKCCMEARNMDSPNYKFSENSNC